MGPLWESNRSYRLSSEKNAQTKTILHPISEQILIPLLLPKGFHLGTAFHSLASLDIDAMIISARLTVQLSPKIISGGPACSSSSLHPGFWPTSAASATALGWDWAESSAESEDGWTLPLWPTWLSVLNPINFAWPITSLEPASLWWKATGQNLTFLSSKSMLSSSFQQQQQQQKVKPGSRAVLISSTKIRSSVILKWQEPWSQGQCLPTTYHLWKQKVSPSPPTPRKSKNCQATLHVLSSHYTSPCSRN